MGDTALLGTVFTDRGSRGNPGCGRTLQPTKLLAPMEQVSGGGMAHRTCEGGCEDRLGEHLAGGCGSARLPVMVLEAKDFMESQN